MKVTREFEKVATDYIAESEGYTIIEPGEVYSKQLIDNSHVIIEKNVDGLYDIRKVKHTRLGDDLDFLNVLEVAKKEFNVMSAVEDFIDWCRSQDEEDNVVDFASKKKRKPMGNVIL